MYHHSKYRCTSVTAMVSCGAKMFMFTIIRGTTLGKANVVLGPVLVAKHGPPTGQLLATEDQFWLPNHALRGPVLAAKMGPGTTYGSQKWSQGR